MTFASNVEPEKTEELYRLHYHFTTPTNWMNDQNGTIHHNGWYYLLTALICV
jgi:sucrose-6-phosphate hydrolase SacC (GH32 family)